MEIVSKKRYIAPVVTRFLLDNSISLVMMSAPPNPDPRGGSKPNNNESQPFQSPFGDKPFS